MPELHSTSSYQPEQQLTQSDLERIYTSPCTDFSSVSALEHWLSEHGVDLTLADSKKGLSKLFGKIEKGEAKIVYDEGSKTVFRVARAAKIAVEATLHGEQYPLLELCQIFLDSPVTEEALLTQDIDSALALIDKLDVRSAHVRDSQELWETLIQDEDAGVGARRGLQEELGYSEEEAALATMNMQTPRIEYEAPIDWPGIHSVLETNEGYAVLPEEISRAAYVELEGDDQITIFVATPGAPVIRSLLKKIIPQIHFVHTPDRS